MARILQQNVVDREGAGGTRVCRCRDSGNNFGVPEIELLPGHIIGKEARRTNNNKFC